MYPSVFTYRALFQIHNLHPIILPIFSTMDSLKDRLATLHAEIDAVENEINEIRLEKCKMDKETNTKLIKFMDSSDGRDRELEECIEYVCRKGKDMTKSLEERMCEKQEQLRSLRKDFEDFQQAFDRYQTNAFVLNVRGTPGASLRDTSTHLSYWTPSVSRQLRPAFQTISPSSSTITPEASDASSPSISGHLSYRSLSALSQAKPISDDLTSKYPTIIKSDDGDYYELTCICGRNAQQYPGGSTKFFSGIEGLTGHLARSNHEEFEKWRLENGDKLVKEFVMENCARRLLAQDVDNIAIGRATILKNTMDDACTRETPQPVESGEKRKRRDIVEIDEDDELALEERWNRRAASRRPTESPLSEVDEELLVSKLNRPLRF